MSLHRPDTTTYFADGNTFERSLVVPSRAQSIGLTNAGIAASYPAALLDAWPEAVHGYLTDPANGPVVLMATPATSSAFRRVGALLRRLGIPYRTARP